MSTSACAAVPVGDVVAVRGGFAAGGADLLDDRVRGRVVSSAAVELDAEVVDDDLRALAGQLERVGATQPAARAGDDGDATLTDPHGGGYRTAVRLGVTIFATDQSMPVPELAHEAEARGLSSLYLPEHTHIPTSRLTPPPTGDPVLPEEYKRTVDPFVVLAAAAAVTSRIRLGTGILLVAQREPLVTAKAVATLDLVSEGRVELGVGFGWNREELADHGVGPAERRAVAREHVLAMQALWRSDVAAFAGAHTSFEPSWSWPKPVQPGGPPVLLGGAPGPTLFAHVAEYGDGWLPIGGAGIREALPALHDACTRAGRDPAEVRVVPFGTIPDPGKLDYYEGLGIDEVVLRVPSAGRDRVLGVLDEYGRVVDARL